jgi:predicted dehydrogenase
MKSTLIVGLGRAGAGLHLPALMRLSKVRESAPRRLLGLDPGLTLGAGQFPGVVPLPGYQALGELDAGSCVAHVCTPPAQRVEAISRLAAAGVRQMIVEKPLASSCAELAEIAALRKHYKLDILVVGNFVSSSLTRRLEELIQSGTYGPVRRLAFTQHKPRIGRSLARREYASAFDIELPHALGATLLLIPGSAQVISAQCSDLVVEGVRAPALGRARLTLLHEGGALSELNSDLGAPIRKRSVEVSFDNHIIRGHYPVSEADHYAQLVVVDRKGRASDTEFIVDDSFLSFMVDAYRYFEEGGAKLSCDFELNTAIVELLSDAKESAGLVPFAKQAVPAREAVHAAP